MGVIGVAIKLGSWRGAFGKDGRVSFSLHVETDDPNDGPFVIRESPLLPKRGSYYAVGNELNTAYVCRNVDPKIDEHDKKFWEVEISYERIDEEDEEEDGEEDNPRPSKRFRADSSIRIEKRVLWQDFTSPKPKLIQNTAKEEYTNPLDENIKILVINISRKEYANPLFRQCRYLDTVNSTSFWGCDAGQVLVESYLADCEGFQKSTSGWNVKYSISIRPKRAGRWDEIEIPSMGYNELKNGKLNEIINDRTGKPFGVEQYLDETGKWKDRLAENFVPYYTKYLIREKEKFSRLRLPDMASLVYSKTLDFE